MVLSREEKEKMVLDLYYNKGYTYKRLTRELRMSPNQIREVIKRHEEKNDAIASKKKMLSLSSQAYKLFSEGKNNVHPTSNAIPYYSATRQPPSLPYQPSGNYDPWSEYRKEFKRKG